MKLDLKKTKEICAAASDLTLSLHSRTALPLYVEALEEAMELLKESVSILCEHETEDTDNISAFVNKTYGFDKKWGLE